MLVLGLQGSPRKKGNTDFLLSAYLKEAEKLGAKTHLVEVAKKDISPCKGCGKCEKDGFCITKDYMSQEIYPMLREADLIVVATPIFFYNTPSQLKALIDRSQAFWSRKYKFNLRDPGHKIRSGILLALGATKGENLFNGLHLTVKYFFDAVSASYDGSLTYRHIEAPGDMEKHPSVLREVKQDAAALLSPLLGRKKVLFSCRENACRSQMAGAFTRYIAGDKIEAISAGSKPASEINPLMVEAMCEKGIDMAFCRPKPIDDAVIADVKPDIIITMGSSEGSSGECPSVPTAKRMDWDMPDPAGKSIDFMRKVRDEIEKKVKDLIAGL